MRPYGFMYTKDGEGEGEGDGEDDGEDDGEGEGEDKDEDKSEGENEGEEKCKRDDDGGQKRGLWKNNGFLKTFVRVK